VRHDLLENVEKRGNIGHFWQVARRLPLQIIHERFQTVQNATIRQQWSSSTASSNSKQQSLKIQLHELKNISYQESLQKPERRFIVMQLVFKIQLDVGSKRVENQLDRTELTNLLQNLVVDSTALVQHFGQASHCHNLLLKWRIINVGDARLDK
jgi:hypothetical protein